MRRVVVRVRDRADGGSMRLRGSGAKLGLEKRGGWERVRAGESFERWEILRLNKKELGVNFDRVKTCGIVGVFLHIKNNWFDFVKPK